MIVRMSKYSFLVYHREYAPFLEKIREIGVVHVIEKQQGIVEQNGELEQIMTHGKRLNSMCRYLKNMVEAEPKKREYAPANKESDGLAKLEFFEELKARVDSLKQRQQVLQKEIEHLSLWGDFDRSVLQKLAKSGWHLNFYISPESSFDESWYSSFHAIEINRVESTIYFATITKAKHPEIEAERARLGEHSLSELRKEFVDNKAQLEKLTAQMVEEAYLHHNTLLYAMDMVSDHVNMEKVKLHTTQMAEDHIMMFEGWVPQDREKQLIDFLHSEGVVYATDKTKPSDKAPILLKNNRFAKLLEPVGALYSLPNYGEVDLTPFFAPFFVIFFGLCLGDTGYGMLFVLTTLFMMKRAKPEFKPFLWLGFWLGLSAVIFGFISGTFFGISLLDVDWPWIQEAKNFMLDSNQLFNLSLIIGAVQITFGLFIRAIGRWIRFGFKYSLDTFGWILCLLGNGAVYGLTMLGELDEVTAQPFHQGITGMALFMMLVFNDPDANIFMNIGGGLWGLYNKMTGILGDMLSYIRLFALGISGSVMGLVFNQLAISMAPDIPVLGQIVMIVILVFGHAMNIFMSSLGAFVHPMRLTFVEFYNNAGFEGGGKKYNPFEKSAK